MADAITYNIQFDDPSRTYAAYYAGISTELAAAASAWIQQIGTSATNSIDIQVNFDSTYSEGQLTTTSAIYEGTVRGINQYEEGLAPKVTTGTDPNGSTPDLVLSINPQYLTNSLWFDPDPTTRTAAVPSDKLDAESVFLSWFGHAYAFNGWLNSSGQPAAGYESTYDRFVTNVGGRLYFTGPHAEAVYGGPVPLTDGSYISLGNAQGAGSDLSADLMTGAGLAAGTRYSISSLDAAILQDYLTPVTSDGSAVSNNGPVNVHSVGVYRFLDTRYGTHFFTASASEAEGLMNPNASTYRSDLKIELNTFGAIDPSVGDPHEVKVYRFLDTSYGTHFFTVSASEAQGLMNSSASTYRPDLVYEPQSFFYEDSVQQPGEAAIYRFLDTANGTHFYTGDAGEAQGLITPGTSTYRPTFVNEGISFYAPAGSYNLTS